MLLALMLQAAAGSRIRFKDATQRVYRADQVPAEMLLDYQMYQQRKLQEEGNDGRRDARKQNRVAKREAEEKPSPYYKCCASEC